jgi:putative hydrolase of the HAD superfamily
MEPIKAIGFDLFETLVTIKSLGSAEAHGRLVGGLRSQGLAVADEVFLPAYRGAARRFAEETRKEGKETHNRFWISAALHHVGHPVSPDDPRIAVAIEAYFSAFLDYATLIPGTLEILATLKRRYRLGLLSNFTHAPAAVQILERLGLAPFFDVVLVSGQLGYRKPHPLVFRHLIDQLGVPKEQIAFVGDNLEADVYGAHQAGIRPIWMTYVQAQQGSATLGRVEMPAGQADATIATIASWQEILPLLGAP